MNVNVKTSVNDWLWSKRRLERPTVSQKKAADIAGVCKQTYRNWEDGKSHPDIDSIKKLCEHFGWQLPQNVFGLISE